MGVLRFGDPNASQSQPDASSWGQSQLDSLDPGSAFKTGNNAPGIGVVPGRSVTGSKVPLGQQPIPVTMPNVEYKANESSSANSAEHGQGTTGYGIVPMDTESAKLAIFGWTDADRARWARRVWYLGGIDNPNDTAGAINAWQSAVSMAAGFAAMGKPVNPEDVLDMVLSGDPNAMKARARRQNGGTYVQKSVSTNVADPSQARMLIEEAYKSRMGRAPTDAELSTLTSALQQAQRKNPTTTTTTQKFDNNGNLTESDPVTTGGLDPSGFVDQQLNNDPGVAEHQAAAVYFPLLMNALASPVGK